ATATRWVGLWHCLNRMLVVSILLWRRKPIRLRAVTFGSLLLKLVVVQQGRHWNALDWSRILVLISRHIFNCRWSGGIRQYTRHRHATTVGKTCAGGVDWGVGA
ncbi:hypothetical protein F442_22495, partial [Phytophthora nicotianae P10297]